MAGKFLILSFKSGRCYFDLATFESVDLQGIAKVPADTSREKGGRACNGDGGVRVEGAEGC